jgi:hypothetical protein
MKNYEFKGLVTFRVIDFIAMLYPYIHVQIASAIWPAKRGGLCWDYPYKKGTTVLGYGRNFWSQKNTTVVKKFSHSSLHNKSF